MSDYIERLRGELLRAGATKQRRVRVRSLRPALALAAAAAIVAVVVIALPQRSDEREAGPVAAYRVDGGAGPSAALLRERMRVAGIAGTVAIEGDTITVPEAARGLTAPGRLAVYDAERGLRDQPLIDNTAVASAATSEDSMTGEPVVLVKLTAAGEREFEALTRALAQRGEKLGELQHMAISVDDRLYSEPYIDWRYVPDGIDGSEGIQISDNFTRQQARELAAVLDSGPLPGELSAP
jgi:hypothetical protein